jgi:hypothetical protein
MIEQDVVVYQNTSIMSLATDMRKKISSGWRVVSCDFVKADNHIYKGNALVVYEKEAIVLHCYEGGSYEEKVYSGPDIDADVNFSREAMKDYIKGRYGPGSVRTD